VDFALAKIDLYGRNLVARRSGEVAQAPKELVKSWSEPQAAI